MKKAQSVSKLSPIFVSFSLHTYYLEIKRALLENTFWGSVGLSAQSKSLAARCHSPSRSLVMTQTQFHQIDIHSMDVEKDGHIQTERRLTLKGGTISRDRIGDPKNCF